MPRITLTKSELATQAGNDLLKLLNSVTSDGIISTEEVEMLRGWLSEHAASANIPSIGWLRELVHLVLVDGTITQAERVELLVAIERVLPLEDRILAKKRRQVASSRLITETGDAATERQISYLKALGVPIIGPITKWRATELIDETLAKNGDCAPTNRQIMVLRFWDQLSLVSRGRSGVSEWMDEWMTQERWDAWALWKTENGDRGAQSDPSRVPIGIGSEYLRRVQGRMDAATGTMLSARLDDDTGNIVLHANASEPIVEPPGNGSARLGRTIFWTLLAAAAVFIALKLSKSV